MSEKIVPKIFINLIISAEVWDTENNKNGEIENVRLIELHYPPEMGFQMFMKLRISSIKDILLLLYLIFTLVKAGETKVEALPFLHSSEWILLSHQTTRRGGGGEVKGGVVQKEKPNKSGWDLLSNQPFQTHTSYANDLLQLHAFHQPPGEGGRFP